MRARSHRPAQAETERTFDGLRLAVSLAERHGRGVKLFLFGEATVSADLAGQPTGAHFDPHEMLKSIAAAGGEVGCCGSCLEARRIEVLVPGAKRATLGDLASWVEAADKVVTF